ncbi:MAG: hypothetical protein H6739_09855 [Alphaproteobacteria bacterium]|nr:hypothetical protein [Alphaproteobacteria bacterium]
MALPRKHSRPIRVGGHALRWMVRSLPEGPIAHRLTVAASEGRRLEVDFHYGDGLVSMTPGVVAHAIQKALSTGWRPAEPGPPLRLLHASPEPPQRSDVYTSHDDTEGYDLGFCVSAWPVRQPFPWPHRQGSFLSFRLDGACTGVDMGTLLAALITQTSNDPSKPWGGDWDAVLDSQVLLGGGMVLLHQGALRMAPGCCCGLEEWPAWRDLADLGGETWNGHDPYAKAVMERERGRVVFHAFGVDADPEATEDERLTEVSVDLYRRLVAHTEADLCAFFALWARFLERVAGDKAPAVLTWTRRMAEPG